MNIQLFDAIKKNQVNFYSIFVNKMEFSLAEAVNGSLVNSPRKIPLSGEMRKMVHVLWRETARGQMSWQLLMWALDRVTLFFIAHKLILYGATVTYRITVWSPIFHKHWLYCRCKSSLHQENIFSLFLYRYIVKIKSALNHLLLVSRLQNIKKNQNWVKIDIFCRGKIFEAYS